MFDQMKQLYQMKKKFDELQKQLQTMKVEKSDSKGTITIRVNGTQRVESLQIDPQWLSPDKKENLESALRQTINGALDDVQKKLASEQGAGFLKEFKDLKLPGM